MTTTIRTHEPRELLALVPYRLGFQPQESLVVLSVRAERLRIGLVARVDLADLADPRSGPPLARSLVAHLVKDGACRGVAVVYTEADLQVEGGVGTGGAAVANLRRAALVRLAGLDVLVVGQRGYYAFGCQDRTCCPPGGRPLTDLQSTRVGAQMVLEGVRVAGSREELVRIAGVDAAARKSARRASDRWRSRGLAAATGAQVRRWRREGLELWREAVARADEAYAKGTDGGVGATGARWVPCPWKPPGPAFFGRLLAALDDVLVRDAVVLTCVPGADRVADRVVAGGKGEDVDAALATVVDPVRGSRPDLRRTAAARAVLEQVAAHSGRSGHAPALTLLALLAWWEGDGARAGVLVDRALAADPDHRMANLLDHALGACMPPGWVNRAAG
jgi:hypothetical protein